MSIQAQIIALLKRLCREHGTAVMLVTHDMGVIAETCDRVAVMYAGPHRRDRPGRRRDPPAGASVHGRADGRDPVDATTTAGELAQIDGAMPRLTAIPSGCAFHPRCPRASRRCDRERPDLMPAQASLAACWLHDQRHRAAAAAVRATLAAIDHAPGTL